MHLVTLMNLDAYEGRTAEVHVALMEGRGWQMLR
jgi:hypothetical protein